MDRLLDDDASGSPPEAHDRFFGLIVRLTPLMSWQQVLMSPAKCEGVIMRLLGA
jgi:hypothetical protein